MPLARAIAPFLATALSLCACVLKVASALESECSACEVVAAALASRVAAEGAQTVLDLRGRLGPQAGQRKGKRLPWKSSETRLESLLEGLCDSGSLDADFAVREREREKTVGLSIIAKDDDDDDDDDEDDEDDDDAGSRREALWLRRGGGGESEEARGFVRVTEAREKDSRSKQLEAWCGRLVSEVEEGLARELAAAGGGGGEGKESGGSGGGTSSAPFDARAALCERLTRSCAPAKKEEESAAAAAAKPSAAKSAAAKAKAAPASSPKEKENEKRSWRGKKQQREEL